jgi:hypothetical protein
LIKASAAAGDREFGGFLASVFASTSITSSSSSSLFSSSSSSSSESFFFLPRAVVFFFGFAPLPLLVAFDFGLRRPFFSSTNSTHSHIAYTDKQ